MSIKDPSHPDYETILNRIPIPLIQGLRARVNRDHMLYLWPASKVTDKVTAHLRGEGYVFKDRFESKEDGCEVLVYEPETVKGVHVEQLLTVYGVHMKIDGKLVYFWPAEKVTEKMKPLIDGMDLKFKEQYASPDFNGEVKVYEW